MLFQNLDGEDIQDRRQQNAQYQNFKGKIFYHLSEPVGYINKQLVIVTESSQPGIIIPGKEVGTDNHVQVCKIGVCNARR